MSSYDALPIALLCVFQVLMFLIALLELQEQMGLYPVHTTWL